MSKSGRVRLGDLRRAFRLLDDCRDVGHDPDGWAPVLAVGLTRLFGARVGTVGELDVRAPGGPQGVLLAFHGWANAEESEAYRRAVMEEKVYLKSTAYLKLAARPGRIVTRSRGQDVEDREWYRSWEFQNVNRPFGIDDQMGSFLHATEPLITQLITVFRPLNDPHFLPRERRLMRLFHDEFSRHYGRTVLCRSRAPFDGYSRRLRQTLRCLLEGDSEKQIAARLGLSRHTVHGYVLELYRRLGVSSRAELMAHCLRLRISPDEAAPPP